MNQGSGGSLSYSRRLRSSWSNPLISVAEFSLSCRRSLNSASGKVLQPCCWKWALHLKRVHLGGCSDFTPWFGCMEPHSCRGCSKEDNLSKLSSPLVLGMAESYPPSWFSAEMWLPRSSMKYDILLLLFSPYSWARRIEYHAVQIYPYGQVQQISGQKF